jgi:endonuclease/exonuclease/phosphatase family metal-dependent hydrolase
VHHGPISKPIARGLRELQDRIALAEIPSSKLDETLNIATWNIRELGRRPRSEASLHYIAEILGVFDVIAIVELRDNIADLARILRYLGPYWRVVFSDYLTDAGGNRERVAYVYDTRAATFTGLASYALPLRKKQVEEYVPEISWWRNPYIASFQAGNFDFIVVTAHIRWGKNAQGRVPELELLANWIAKRSAEQFLGDKDILLMGDFNIPSRDSDLFRAITSKGLQIAPGLLGAHGSNLARDKRYDQILHDPKYVKSFTSKGGVLDFYRGDHQPLYPGTTMTKRELTYEMSDHLPLWIQVATDTDAEQLDQVLQPSRTRKKAG